MPKLKFMIEVEIGRYPEDIAKNMIMNALNNCGLQRGIVEEIE